MKLKFKRLTFFFLSIALLSVALILVLVAFRDNIVFFYSPSEIMDKGIVNNQKLRVGGLVREGSIKQIGGGTVLFDVTDLRHSINVQFTGILPDLFREKQGVVTEGYLKNGKFFAREVLAKHDENYMPPEVADAIKKSGKWKGEK